MTIRLKWSAATAVAGALALVLPLMAMLTTTASPSRAATMHLAGVHTGHLGKGLRVHAATSTKPFAPTTAQKKARTENMKFLAHLAKPPVGPHTTAASVKKIPGAQTPISKGPQASTDFKVFQDSVPPNTCSGCSQSTVNEPDTANTGRFIMQTSNWNIAYSTDGGDAKPQWSYQNPYSISGSNGFCCDQTVTAVPSRNRFFYEGLTLGTGAQTGFTLAETATWNPTSWCVYHFDGSMVGGTAGDLLDYPKIAFDNNNMFVTWNEYDSSGSSWLFTGLVRIPIDALSSCSGFGYSYVTRTDNFTFGLTYGNSSLDTFYWVSNWYTSGSGSGTSERIYHWPDNSGTYYYSDISVASYNFSGGSCASTDGVVTNWCSRLDPRWESAWISGAEYNAQANAAFGGDTILGVAITAGPGGGDPFPYVIYEYFKLNSLSYVTTAATYNDGFAFAYPGCAPDVYGYVGCSMSWGGGANGSDYYPGGFLVVQDNVNPTQPWLYSFALWGAGNASAWGDYMVTQPWQPAVGPWITTMWAVNGNGAVQDHEVVFGRVRDTNGWYRFKKV